MKTLLVAFNGEMMCFAHVLLNALDMYEKGQEVKIMIEGSATKLIAELDEPGKPFSNQYKKVMELGLVSAVCRACSAKMGALEAAEAQKLPIVGDMSGHPALLPYIQEEYTVITF